MSYPSRDVEAASSTLYITLVPGAQDALAGFPWMEAYEGEDQCIVEEYEENGNPMVAINLGYRTDTTAAQEQFLDTSDQVVGYRVSANAI